MPEVTQASHAVGFTPHLPYPLVLRRLKAHPWPSTGQFVASDECGHQLIELVELWALMLDQGTRAFLRCQLHKTQGDVELEEERQNKDDEDEDDNVDEEQERASRH